MTARRLTPRLATSPVHFVGIRPNPRRAPQARLKANGVSLRLEAQNARERSGGRVALGAIAVTIGFGHDRAAILAFKAMLRALGGVIRLSDLSFGQPMKTEKQVTVVESRSPSRAT